MAVKKYISFLRFDNQSMAFKSIIIELCKCALINFKDDFKQLVSFFYKNAFQKSKKKVEKCPNSCKNVKYEQSTYLHQHLQKCIAMQKSKFHIISSFCWKVLT